MTTSKLVRLHTRERMGPNTSERLSVDTRKRNYMSSTFHERGEQVKAEVVILIPRS